ncbi:glutathione-disulfide reductase [Herbaspirillum sp. RTI4]|uniref:glutathione-disulfide reductase n=1 Tax=Herbaspirillum sp. RTI4 TaxID=3048640 RepID=UPI002AB38AF5|nr:glutathione-disulfide reductase [Herbaspirillum sp. RTI4]MDY7578021.1 glutathione-disulfide reductase [Herbaspirillum sp. RTI4]MEA9982049.1 glutathione-disulfide reductase [Herbaspirillum sp. RTI4]
MSTYDYDLLTIGAGSGGVRASRFAAQYGAKVGIVEQQYLGGTCVNVGCIPKKLMAYAAHFHGEVEDARGFGWQVEKAVFDWATLIANKDVEIARLNSVYRRLLDGSGVDILDGHAVIEDAHTVLVGDRRLTSAHILIATGGKPTAAEFPGSEYAISSDEFFHLDALPARSVVYGGGYIAVELASILNGLGSEVTLIYRGAQLLRTMDADLGVFLVEEMRKKGMRVLLDTRIEAIDAGEQDSAGCAVRQVRLSGGASLDADCVLLATGRAPNTYGLGLEAAGVTLKPNGAVIVDDQFQTSVPSIHAIGDVIDRIALTPVALAEGMVVASRLFKKGADSAREMSYDNVPTAVFSDPNIATVGLTEQQARERFDDIRVFKSSFKALRHTLSGRDEKTLMKLLVDAKTDRVLGVHMVGADAGEIVQGFAVALQCGATKAQFDATIGIHPTSAEEFVTMRTPID